MSRRSNDGGELVKRLNRDTRATYAKLHFDEAIPFGESLHVNRYRLGNGLTVLTLVDRSAPVVSYHTWFRVGSRHETPGKTGLAHLFEHLMFNETENHPAGEFDRLLEEAGGETNAATWTDWTFYFENLPKKHLRLAVELESDRMANLVLREPQVVSEKEVVANERRYRVDDDVEGAVNEQLYARAFRKHPYHWPTIGWMEDIEGFTIDDCQRFYRTFYAPNNASVIIVGDIDEAEALSLVQEHYGGLAPQKVPAEQSTEEPGQKRERATTLKQPTETEKVQLGYRGPAFGDYDWAVLTVANEILSGGRSSRLYQLLVNEREIATEAHGALGPFRDPGLYEMWISMRSGKKASEALELVDRELERLRREPVSEKELDKAKNRLELMFLQGMETAGGKAEQIGFYETVLGDPGRVFGRLEEFRQVSADDILHAAKRYLQPRHRTRLMVEPAAASSNRKSRRTTTDGKEVHA